MNQRIWEQIKDAGRQAGSVGKPATANPYANKPACRTESEAWETGHTEGVADRKRETRR